MPAAQHKIVPNGRHGIETKDGITRWNQNTQYCPTDCERVIELMSQGLTACQVAKALDVSRRTLDRWRDIYPEFAEAWQMGLDYAQAHLEGVALQHLVIETYKDGPQIKFSERIYTHQMATRFGVSDRADNNKLTVIMSQDQAELDTAKKILKDKVQELLSNDR